MKIAAVSVTSNDLKASCAFYEVLGFVFPEFKPNEDHVEANNSENGIRLMIDSKKLIKEISGTVPIAGNTSSFAIEYSSEKEVDQIASKLKQEGFTLKREPWDAFWGQRYAIAKDPEGYLIDLFAQL